MIHNARPITIEVTCEVELSEVSNAEVELIEASLGELIQAMLLSQEEEG